MSLMSASLGQLLPRLWRRVPPVHKRQFALVFCLASVTAFAEVLTLGALYPFMVILVAPEKISSLEFMQRFLNLLPETSRGTLLWMLTATFTAAVLVATLLRMGLLLAQTAFVNRLGSAFSINIYRRTLHQPYRVHVARNSSEVISIIAGKVNGVVSSVLMPIITIASSLIMLLAVMVSLLAIQPLVALSMLGGFAVIYALVVISVKARLERDGRTVAEQQVLTLKALQEGLGGIRDILIDGTQEIFCKVYATADQKARRASASITFISNLPRSAIEGMGMILIATIACLLALATDEPGGVIPVLGVVALGAQRLLPLVQSLYANWSTMRGHTLALDQVLSLLEQPILNEGRNDQIPPPPLPFSRSIELHGVSFRYQPDHPPVLSGLNLSIPKGSRLGVIGATGSGKSTLIDLLLGLLSPSDGRIEVDGQLLDEQHLNAWQQRVAHVPQSIFLADATIAENIAFGLPRHQIDMERVRQAARRAQIAATIEAMEKGYDTHIGERGVRLSGGQRQRIGIARAMYKRADVLVLDEATSALDNQTESMVMEAVEGLDDHLTIIMIAHRLTTLRGCNLLIEIDKGALRNRGSYEQFSQQQASAQAA